MNEPLTCDLHAGGSSGPPKLISSLSWVLAGTGPEGLTHPVSGVAAELVDDVCEVLRASRRMAPDTVPAALTMLS